MEHNFEKLNPCNFNKENKNLLKDEFRSCNSEQDITGEEIDYICDSDPFGLNQENFCN